MAGRVAASSLRAVTRGARRPHRPDQRQAGPRMQSSSRPGAQAPALDCSTPRHARRRCLLHSRGVRLRDVIQGGGRLRDVIQSGGAAEGRDPGRRAPEGCDPGRRATEGRDPECSMARSHVDGRTQILCIVSTTFFFPNLLALLPTPSAGVTAFDPASPYDKAAVATVFPLGDGDPR